MNIGKKAVWQLRSFSYIFAKLFMYYAYIACIRIPDIWHCKLRVFWPCHNNILVIYGNDAFWKLENTCSTLCTSCHCRLFLGVSFVMPWIALDPCLAADLRWLCICINSNITVRLYYTWFSTLMLWHAYGEPVRQPTKSSLKLIVQGFSTRILRNEF